MSESTPTLVAGGRMRARRDGAGPPACRSLLELLTLLAVEGMPDVQTREVAARITVGYRRVAAGEHLIHMGSPATNLYVVHVGVFKISRTDREGYEQVLGFAGRGETLGCDAMCADEHPTHAVALEDSAVYAIPRQALSDIRRAVPALDRALQRAACAALARSNDLIDIMAAVSAEVRLARFLLQTSRQMAAKGQSPRRFVLRMGRRDIASMLGVAQATVSRSFSALVIARLLHVNDRDIEILDMDALREYARCTRKAQDDIGLAATCRAEVAHRGARRARTTPAVQPALVAGAAMVSAAPMGTASAQDATARLVA